MPVKQRARKDEDKAARRRAILTVAAKLLGKKQYKGITMAEVARRCHLAKGTLYLYFRSKEELFLAALEEEMSLWFDDMVARLPKLPGTGDVADRFGAAVAESLADRQTLVDLLPLLHTVLEHNIDEQSAVSFKLMLVEKVRVGGQVVEQAIAGLPAGSGAQILIRLHALVVGLRQMAHPAPVVAEVLARPEMSALRIDFGRELSAALSTMIRGTLRMHAVAQ